jgi:carbon storage regulator CsrA
MLVLTRKLGESIIIGPGVTVIVARLSRTRVSLAIEAPGGTSVLRNEILAHGDKRRPTATHRQLTETPPKPNETKEEHSAEKRTANLHEYSVSLPGGQSRGELRAGQ